MNLLPGPAQTVAICLSICVPLLLFGYRADSRHSRRGPPIPDWLHDRWSTFRDRVIALPGERHAEDVSGGVLLVGDGDAVGLCVLEPACWGFTLTLLTALAQARKPLTEEQWAAAYMQGGDLGTFAQNRLRLLLGSGMVVTADGRIAATAKAWRSCASSSWFGSPQALVDNDDLVCRRDHRRDRVRHPAAMQWAARRARSSISPVMILAIVAVISHLASVLLGVVMVQRFQYWSAASIFSFGVMSYIFAFGAVYKSVSLEMLLDIAMQPGRGVPLSDIIEHQVPGIFNGRTRILIHSGLAERIGPLVATTPTGRKFADRIVRLRRAFAIGDSGLYDFDD